MGGENGLFGDTAPMMVHFFPSLHYGRVRYTISRSRDLPHGPYPSIVPPSSEKETIDVYSVFRGVFSRNAEILVGENIYFFVNSND